MADAVYEVKVAKAGTTFGWTEEEIKNLPPHVWTAVVQEGLKHFMSVGMSKITTAKLEGEALARAQAVAKEKAEENKAAMLSGKIRIAGVKASKSGVPAEVLTAARNLAKTAVKAEMKRQKIKVSTVAASEITKAANALLAADPSFIEQAKANLEAASKAGAKIDVSQIAIDPKLVAKAEADKAAKKKGGTLSAAQAGKVKPKAKPVQASA